MTSDSRLLPGLFFFVASSPSNSPMKLAAVSVGFDGALSSGHPHLLSAIAGDTTDLDRIERLAALGDDHPAAETVINALLSNPATPVAVALGLLPRARNASAALGAVTAHPDSVELAAEIIQLWPKSTSAVCELSNCPVDVLHQVVANACKIPTEQTADPMFLAAASSDHATTGVLAALPWRSLLELVDELQRPEGHSPLEQTNFGILLAQLLEERLGGRVDMWQALWALGEDFAGTASELFDGLDAVAS